jgi:hypothetical protein
MALLMDYLLGLLQEASTLYAVLFFESPMVEGSCGPAQLGLRCSLFASKLSDSLMSLVSTDRPSNKTGVAGTKIPTSYQKLPN